MSKAKSAFLYLVLLLMVGSSFSYAAEKMVVNEAFNGREIKVQTGNMIQVALPETGASGSAWEIQDLDKEHFEVTSVKTAEPPAVGETVARPVLKIWLIRAKAKGKSELRFIHFGLPEGETNAADTFVLRVRIL